MTRGIFLRNAAGLVFTSGELQGCGSFAPFNRPNVVIANGIDLSQNPESPAPGNGRPRIGFIGTPDLSWQGVDKIVRLAELCPDLDIDVIGFDGLAEGSRKPENLIFHGYLEKEEARAVLAKDDVGLGTLALHRKGMDEASSLKTREYLAYGIPVIIPYVDTDLDDLKVDTILNIPNTEDTIDRNWQAIHDFAFRMRGQRVDRTLISQRIDSHIKEKVRLQFFEECRNGSKTINEKTK
jgi:glycosyltransferase involved in cell wall biosynthesis